MKKGTNSKVESKPSSKSVLKNKTPQFPNITNE